jgi:hypothetical protein
MLKEMKKNVIVLTVLFFCCSGENMPDIPPGEREMEVALAIIRLEMAERLASSFSKTQTSGLLTDAAGYLPRKWAYPDISHIMKNSEGRLKLVLDDIEEMENESIVMMPCFLEDRLDQLANDNLNEGVPNMMDEDWTKPDAVASVLLSVLWNRIPPAKRYTQPKMETKKSDTVIWSFRIADGKVADENAALPKPYFIVKVKNEAQGWDVYLQTRLGRMYLSPFFGKLSPNMAVEKTLMEAQIHAVAYSASTMSQQDIRHTLSNIRPSYVYTSNEDFSYSTLFGEAKQLFDFVNTQLQSQKIADTIVTRHSAVEQLFNEYIYSVYRDTEERFSISLSLFSSLWGCSPRGYTLPRRVNTPDGDEAYYFKLTDQASPIDCSCKSNPDLCYYVPDNGSIQCYRDE